MVYTIPACYNCCKTLIFYLKFMELFKITVEKNDETLEFEVADFVHHEEEHCKYEVYQAGKMVASFEPDRHHLLHICKNPGQVDEQVLHQLAEKIEALNL